MYCVLLPGYEKLFLGFLHGNMVEKLYSTSCKIRKKIHIYALCTARNYQSAMPVISYIKTNQIQHSNTNTKAKINANYGSLYKTPNELQHTQSEKGNMNVTP